MQLENNNAQPPVSPICIYMPESGHTWHYTDAVQNLSPMHGLGFMPDELLHLLADGTQVLIWQATADVGWLD